MSEESPFISRAHFSNLERAIISVTRYEKPVLNLLIKGIKTEEIAEQLGMSEGNVKYHLTNLYIKFGVKRRAQLICLIAGLKSNELQKYGNILYTPKETEQINCPLVQKVEKLHGI